MRLTQHKFCRRQQALREKFAGALLFALCNPSNPLPQTLFTLNNGLNPRPEAILLNNHPEKQIVFFSPSVVLIVVISVLLVEEHLAFEAATVPVRKN
ncbi:MAG: hypothetical protein AAB658_14125 [Chloroflexota bacterium]